MEQTTGPVCNPHEFQMKDAIVMKTLPVSCLLGGPFLADNQLLVNMAKRELTLTHGTDDRTLHTFPCRQQAFTKINGGPEVLQVDSNAIPAFLDFHPEDSMLQPLESRRVSLYFARSRVTPNLEYVYEPLSDVAERTGLITSEGTIDIQNPQLLVIKLTKSLIYGYT